MLNEKTTELIATATEGTPEFDQVLAEIKTEVEGLKQNHNLEDIAKLAEIVNEMVDKCTTTRTRDSLKEYLAIVVGHHVGEAKLNAFREALNSEEETLRYACRVVEYETIRIKEKKNKALDKIERSIEPCTRHIDLLELDKWVARGTKTGIGANPAWADALERFNLDLVKYTAVRYNNQTIKQKLANPLNLNCGKKALEFKFDAEEARARADAIVKMMIGDEYSLDAGKAVADGEDIWWNLINDTYISIDKKAKVRVKLSDKKGLAETFRVVCTGIYCGYSSIDIATKAIKN